MIIEQFRLLIPSNHRPAGTTVYTCAYQDFGGAGDDARATGQEHKSVTLDANGDYPFFTVPVSALKKVDQREVSWRPSAYLSQSIPNGEEHES